MTRSSTHHIKVKYLLASMALQDLPAFFQRFGPGGDALYLPHLWQAIGLQQLDAADRVPHDGVNTWHRPASERGPEALVLTLPTPQARNEMFFLGVLRTSERSGRVFCLENAVSPVPGQIATVMAEFMPHGRAHWGPGCAPARDDFVALMHMIAFDPQAQPASFIEIRLA